MIHRRSLACLAVLAFTVAGHTWAEETAKPNLFDNAFGGPSGVTREQQDISDLLNAYRTDNRKLVLKPWYDWKENLKQRSGFSFGLNSQMVYASVDHALGNEDDAAGGVHRLQGEWSLFGRGTDHPGSIIFRIENRSKIGSGIAPASLRQEIGAAATDPVFAYSDNFGTDFSVLAWQQLFAGKKAGIAVGLLDFSAYLDAMYYQTLSRGFLNRSFILAPTLATTGVGAVGAAGKGMINDNIWVGGGFYDANAKSGDPSFDTWNSSELLKHIELGWSPGFSRRATDRVQITWWQKDRLTASNTPSGTGWLLSWSWMFEDQWVPFIRAGWSDGGGGALAEQSVSGGFSWKMAFQDWITMGIGFNKPSVETHGEDLSTETVFEASYLWQLTANTSITPDLQLILDPARNPEESTVWSAGLRLRLTF